MSVTLIALQRGLQHHFDPAGIMNPGKVFPDPGGIDAFHLPTSARRTAPP